VPPFPQPDVKRVNLWIVTDFHGPSPSKVKRVNGNDNYFIGLFHNDRRNLLDGIHEESRKAGEKLVHGFMGSLSKRGFIQRLLTSSPTSITNGFAGGWFRHEKPLRFRADPAGAAQARPVRENRADEHAPAWS
jgi:hypothetical protein